MGRVEKRTKISLHENDVWHRFAGKQAKKNWFRCDHHSDLICDISNVLFYQIMCRTIWTIDSSFAPELSQIHTFSFLFSFIFLGLYDKYILSVMCSVIRFSLSRNYFKFLPCTDGGCDNDDIISFVSLKKYTDIR